MRSTVVHDALATMPAARGFERRATARASESSGEQIFDLAPPRRRTMAAGIACQLRGHYCMRLLQTVANPRDNSETSRRHVFTPLDGASPLSFRAPNTVIPECGHTVVAPVTG